MINIIFEAHGTTIDNEAKLSSGWNDTDLSDLGLKQSAEMGERYKNSLPDAVFCSDTQRSYKSAAIAFKNTNVPVYIDERLRECDYGDLTQAPKAGVDDQKAERISIPFPSGESYEDCAKRMGEFLKELLSKHNNKIVMIIGHRSTQYGLEHHIMGKDLKTCVTEPWAWQPGWSYELEAGFGDLKLS